mgnify:FL=1
MWLWSGMEPHGCARSVVERALLGRWSGREPHGCARRVVERALLGDVVVVGRLRVDGKVIPRRGCSPVRAMAREFPVRMVRRCAVVLRRW